MFNITFHISDFIVFFITNVFIIVIKVTKISFNLILKNIDNTYLTIFHFKPLMRFEYPYIMPQMEFKHKNDIET